MRPWPLVLLLVSSSAWALKPAEHRDLEETACYAAGLPPALCDRAGKQAYETDYLEWTDLSAHAQRERGQDRCSAADAAIARLDVLGRALVGDAQSGAYEQAAIDLGRAIHTLQDECAHHGITNQEHAYYSLEQECTGDAVSPDVQPAAIACADQRTRAAMAVVAAALANVPWTGVQQLCTDADNNDTCAQAVLPTPAMACSFLAEHQDWDGTDSSWDPRTGDLLLAAFTAAIDGEPASPSACGGDLHAIDPPAPKAAVADLDAGCTLANVACLGKVDEGGKADAPPSGGCTAGGAPGLALALLGLRRRRAR